MAVMLVSRALDLWREPLKRPIRVGKSRKDRASGAWAARFTNRAARVEWQHDPRATASNHPSGNR